MTARSVHHRALQTFATVAAVAVVLSGASLVGAGSAEAATRVSYTGSLPTWAKKANATGSPSSTTVVQGEAFLALRNQAGATALAKSVSDPASAGYRQYLTPAQWIAAYAPTQSTYSSTVSMLRGRGLTITGQPAGRQYIVFRGTVAAIQKAFSTSLRTYSVDGQDLIAPATTPSLATSAGKTISGLTLDQGRLLTKPASTSQAGSARSAGSTLSSLRSLLTPALSAPASVTVKTPCSSYLSQHLATVPSTYGTTRISTANCGYTPKQIRSIYKTSASSGSGQTVAIVDAYDSPTMRTDVDTYSRRVGEPTLTASQYVDLSPSKTTFTDKKACGNPSGWQGEQTLDVEAVHAVAPKATILYVGATDCGAGTDVALSRILDKGLATIVSNSYGSVGEPSSSGSKDYVQGEVNLQLQAAGEGIGLYFASGDDGDERANTGTYQADFPASSPWVTAVGGTSVGLTKTNSTAFTMGWGNTLDQIVPGAHRTLRYHSNLPGTLFAGGAGGGRSRIAAFTEPWYQKSVIPTSVAAGRRAVPDVAALADPFTGFLIGYHPISNETTLATHAFGLGVAGGTSLATPITAALVATVQQQTKAVVGFANPALYSVAKSTPSAFADVLPRAKKVALAYSDGHNSYTVTLDTDSSLKTTKGYDFVTGLGQLNIAAAAKFATPARPKPKPTPTPTPKPSPTATPSPTSSSTPTPTPAPSDSSSPEPTDTPSPDPTP
ncbi:serine protease [Frondihabitans sucicola]|uniref:Serine protease n=1 Tax=Frondihabitans sucicola TaxID=1268041 RepID=A0ABM8GU66_9MICO|nr:S53 family peptidase [Frondihabitans sucicola]BDZ51978.1 serine protease [Frondihabitans sucicola]